VDAEPWLHRNRSPGANENPPTGIPRNRKKDQTMITDIADLRDSIITEAKDRAAAERSAAYKAQEDAARKHRAAQTALYSKRIGACLPKEALWSVDESNGHLIIDQIDVSWIVSIESTLRHISAWRSEPTGKTRIVVGDYGNRKSYPQRKDGTHRYADIADTLYQYARRRVAENTARKIQEANKVGQCELSIELGDSHGFGYNGNLRLAASSDAAKPIRCSVSFAKNMTADEVRALHAALKSLGLDK